MRKQAELLEQEPLPQPLLSGRDLIALGHRPGPRFREILDRAFDAQLEGRDHDARGRPHLGEARTIPPDVREHGV